MKRIARGLKKFVIDNPEPFIVQINHSGQQFRGQSIDEPMPTLTAKHGFGVVTPYISQVKRCGNAVCPPISAALVKANLPELCIGKRLPICRNDRLEQEKTGQLRFA